MPAVPPDREYVQQYITKSCCITIKETLLFIRNSDVVTVQRVAISVKKNVALCQHHCIEVFFAETDLQTWTERRCRRREPHAKRSCSWQRFFSHIGRSLNCNLHVVTINDQQVQLQIRKTQLKRAAARLSDLAAGKNRQAGNVKLFCDSSLPLFDQK